MKVVIAGGAGFLGNAVVRSLKARGHRPIGLVIDDDDVLKVQNAGGVGIKADLSTPEGLEILRRQSTDADATMNCIKVCHRTRLDAVDPDARVREKQESIATAEWEKVNLDIVNVVLDALKGTEKPFIYSNSTVMIGDMGEDIADEETKPKAASYYGHWQRRHEQMVLDSAASGIRAVSLRAGMFYGPHPNGLALGRPHPANMHQQLWEEGCVGYLGDGSAISTGVHTDDYADLFALALEKAPAGSMYYGGSVDYTRKELALALSYACGYGGKIRSWTLEEARAVLGDTMLMRFLADNHRTTSAKAARELGWKPWRPSLVEYAKQEAVEHYGSLSRQVA